MLLSSRPRRAKIMTFYSRPIPDVLSEAASLPPCPTLSAFSLNGCAQTARIYNWKKDHQQQTLSTTCEQMSCPGFSSSIIRDCLYCHRVTSNKRANDLVLQTHTVLLQVSQPYSPPKSTLTHALTH